MRRTFQRSHMLYFMYYTAKYIVPDSGHMFEIRFTTPLQTKTCITLNEHLITVNIIRSIRCCRMYTSLIVDSGSLNFN